jgi:Ca-activated chloride channel family protein
MMRWANPEYLSLLLLVGVLSWLMFRNRNHCRPTLLFSNVRLFQQSRLVAHRYQTWMAPCLRISALVLVVLALARPQFGKTERTRKASGVDALLVLDVSGSMQALDFEINGETVNRLQTLQHVARDFIEKRPSDRMGLLVFGSNAFTQCPLTLDHDILINYLDELQIGMAGDGTAIGDGLTLAVKRLQSVESKSRFVVLLTDGENTAGQIDPLLAARVAQENGIKVYAIGIGRDGRVPFPVDSPFGGRRVGYVDLRVDMETLRKIAEITGGEVYRALNTEELQAIYETINKLEKTDFKIREYAIYDEKMSVFAFPALLFLMAEAALGLFRRLRRVA